jgi:hypothetical protein
VERLGIAHRIVAADPHQRQHKTVVIEQHVKVLMAFPERTQAEIPLKEPPRRGHVIDSEMQMVELHRVSAVMS